MVILASPGTEEDNLQKVFPESIPQCIGIESNFVFNVLFHVLIVKKKKRRDKIELISRASPADIQQKLVTEAARKNLKGYSAIIVKALREYFEKQDAGETGKEIRKLRGSLSQQEYEKALEMLDTGRTQWRT